MWHGQGSLRLTLTRKYYIIKQNIVEAGNPYKEFSGVVIDIFDGYTYMYTMMLHVAVGLILHSYYMYVSSLPQRHRPASYPDQQALEMSSRCWPQRQQP